MASHTELLERLKSSGVITPLDFHLALFFNQQLHLTDSQVKARFALLIVWLSIAVREGHVCINLSELKRENLELRFGRELANHVIGVLDSPTVDDWIVLCQQVGVSMISDGGTLAPFILQAHRLYFQRMWQYEKQVADYFNRNIRLDIPDQIAKSLLNSLYPNNLPDEIDWQKVATASAIIHPVAVVSGGPGTGKTTTVSKILAILVALHQQISDKPLRIVAAAPTGKAAARLTESLSKVLKTLTVSDSIKKCIPVEAVTLHRLLGSNMSNNRYLYNQQNPLSVDLLLIDEASMIDLPMMSSVIEALPDHSRLILLGDKEQLSSVEAGAVFGDLCEKINVGYSTDHVAMINSLTDYQLVAKTKQQAIADNISLLQKSYRFSNQSGIGELAKFVKEGKSRQAIKLLNRREFTDITFFAMNDVDKYQLAIESCVNSYRDYLQMISTNPAHIIDILIAFSKFRLLCALRDGSFGVKGLNRIIEQRLHQQQAIHLSKNDVWYIGRPVMILKNSMSLGIFNGDIGITLPAIEDSSKLKVYFLLPDGEVKGISPFRLPEHETAYAMTIHKSQGSEFNHVSIILPNEYSPILTRSLLNTAITRAKQHVTIFASEAIVEKAIYSQVNRESGLVDLLI